MPTPTIPNPLEEARALVKHWRAISARASERVSANPTDAMSLNYAVTISECADALDALLPRLEEWQKLSEPASRLDELRDTVIALWSEDLLTVDERKRYIQERVAVLKSASQGDAARQPVGLTEDDVAYAIKNNSAYVLNYLEVPKVTAALNAALHASAPASATVQEGQQPTSDPPSQRLSSTSRVVPSGPEASGHSTAADSDRAKLERLVMFTYRNFGPYQVYNDIAALLAAFEASESERGKS